MTVTSLYNRDLSLPVIIILVVMWVIVLSTIESVGHYLRDIFLKVDTEWPEWPAPKDGRGDGRKYFDVERP
jgi:hypothetical protein